MPQTPSWFFCFYCKDYKEVSMQHYCFACLIALTSSLTGTASPRDNSLRFVSEKRHQQLLEMLPPTKDPWLTQLKTKDIIFYDDESMPPAYQDWGSGLPGVHSPFYNISASKPAEQFGNANREFPWGTTAGLDRATNANTVRFVVFPDKPIRWWREHLPHDTAAGGTFRWIYPEGTIFGEILNVENHKGYSFPFELRVRVRGKDKWSVNVYRPFATPEDLVERVKQLKADDDTTKEFLAYFAGDRSGAVGRLRNHHPVEVFDEEAFEEQLPPLKPALVEKLLNETPFQPVRSQIWAISASNKVAFAPTTKEDFHVVPKNYTGAYFEVSDKGCMRCHETVQKSTSDFQPFRDWYGRVRGSDAIFSFHIFDPSSISYSGIPLPVRFNQKLVDAGLLVPYGSE
jgi:hypothetical protein